MKRLLITRKATGIGSDLISVVGALDYAIRTGRDLVIDWRGSRYVSDPHCNLFDALFDINAEIEGCSVTVAAPSDSDTAYPGPVLQSEDWPFDVYHDDMLHGRDRSEASLIVTRPMHHLPDDARQAQLLSHITPKPHLMDKIATFRANYMPLGQTIGLHIRHGNGEPLLQKRGKLIQRGIDRIYAKSLTAIKKTEIDDPTIFLCTDSDDVRSHFCDHFGKVVHWPSQLLGADQGPIHTDAFGLAGAQDAVIEMYLLRDTAGLIYNPSWFSHVARVGGDFVHPPISIDNNSDYGTMDVYEKRAAKRAAD